MDQNTLNTIAVGLVTAAALTGNAAVEQVAKVTGSLIQAWPAIQKGLASEKPFFDLIEKIISTGPVTTDDFDAMLAGLTSQIATMQAEEDADNAAG